MVSSYRDSIFPFLKRIIILNLLFHTIKIFFLSLSVHLARAQLKAAHFPIYRSIPIEFIEPTTPLIHWFLHLKHDTSEETGLHYVTHLRKIERYL